MHTAFIVLCVWLAVALPLGVFCGRCIAFAGGMPPEPSQERRHGRRWALAIAGVAALLHGCGGSSGGLSAAVVPPAVLGTGTGTPPPPPVTPPAAPVTPPPSLQPAGLPACPVGVTQLYIANCVCPQGDTNGSSCEVPPAAPPAPPPTASAPGISLSASPDAATPGAYFLAWSTSGATSCEGAAGWPINGQLPPQGLATTAVLTGVTSYTLVCSGVGGNTSDSVTVTPPSAGGTMPPGQPAPPTSPPVLNLTLAINPTSVSNDSAGCPDPSGASCVATVTGWPATSSLPGDTVECVDAQGGALNSAAGYSVGPYPQAVGTVVLTVSCQDTHGASTAASITLTVVPPMHPPVDTFTGVGNGDGTWTFTWDTHGANGCEVHQDDSAGRPTVTLTGGGGLTGSSVTGSLSQAYEPYTFSLWCGGMPDNVPRIQVTP